MNEQTLNNTDDVIGTARYVGMGGAMGALGADLSVISWNPAGIGLYRKDDFALTFGGLWNKSHIVQENRGSGTFDQIGFVYNFKTGSDICPYVNFAFNYQKKKNYFYNFFAESGKNSPWLSQRDQLVELGDYGLDTYKNLAGLVIDNNGLNKITTPDGVCYQNLYWNDYNCHTHHSDGSMHGWDFNLSTNIQDRVFLGLTFGVDNINYSSWSDYYELGYYYDNDEKVNYGNYSIWNDYHIHGYGFNFKIGSIVRPFEDNSFRIGVAIESPTWYKLKSDVNMDFSKYVVDKFGVESLDYTSPSVNSYLPFNINTPWKFRASMGSTVGNNFAWDVDYEFANYSTMCQRYSDYDSFGGYKDVTMNKHMSDNLKGVHTVRAGMEIRPIIPLAFRVGYNFSTSPYENNAHFDQFSLYSSDAMQYITRTNYMITKPTHILSLGMGYRWKNFYFDLAYKIRHQKADFYAFDDSFNADGRDYAEANKDIEDIRGARLAPIPIDLTRQSITCTLGFKF